MKKISILTVFSAIFILTLSSISFGSTSLTWGGIEAVDGILDQTLKWAVEEIEQRSEGDIKIDYYPASQLGNTAEQMDGVAAGTIDMMSVSSNMMGRMGNDWIADTIPFVFKSKEHRIAYNNSDLYKEVNQNLIKTQGIRVIGNNWYGSPHELLTTKLILKPEDIEGLKMRVPEVRGQYIGWEALGTKPTTISWGEVYLALRQGLAEGVSSNFEVVPEMKFHEVAPYITMLNAEFSYEVTMINEKKYQSLTDKQKKIITDVIKDAGDMYTSKTKEGYEYALDLLPKEGATIVFLDTSMFHEKLKDLPDKLDKEGLLSKEVYNKIQALK